MNIYTVEHPLIAHKLSTLRDKNTPSSQFRQLTEELVMLLAYEATRTLRLQPATVTTPVANHAGHTLADPQPVIIPILRAGLGLLEGMVKMIPAAEVGFLGMERDETTLQPRTYAERLPQNLQGRQVYILDPMLATGGTLAMAIDYVLARGASEITVLCVVAAPEGIEHIRSNSAGTAEVTIYTAAIDSHLNEHGFIVPGLGDAGDRSYATVS